MSTIGLFELGRRSQGRWRDLPLPRMGNADGLAAVAFWVLWHIWQIREENAEMKAKSGHLDKKEAKEAIDRY